MSIDELLAREEIRHLMAVYNTAGDSMRTEEFGTVFTEDAQLLTDAFEFQGKAAILDGLFRSVSDSQQANRRPRFVRHNLTTSNVNFDSSTSAKGRTYFQVNTDIGLDHCGVYMDVFRNTDGCWKIFRRVVKTEYFAENSYFRQKADSDG